MTHVCTSIQCDVKGENAIMGLRVVLLVCFFRFWCFIVCRLVGQGAT